MNLKDDKKLSELDWTPNWTWQDENRTDEYILTHYVYAMIRKTMFWVLPSAAMLPNDHLVDVEIIAVVWAGSIRRKYDEEDTKWSINRYDSDGHLTEL